VRWCWTTARLQAFRLASATRQPLTSNTNGIRATLGRTQTIGPIRLSKSCPHNAHWLISDKLVLLVHKVNPVHAWAGLFISSLVFPRKHPVAMPRLSRGSRQGESTSAFTFVCVCDFLASATCDGARATPSNAEFPAWINPSPDAVAVIGNFTERGERE
jgi:hypothetical protein